MSRKQPLGDHQPFRLFKSTLSILAAPVIGAYSWIKGRFANAASDAELRQDEKAKQREIRRELRGLEPETPTPKDKP